MSHRSVGHMFVEKSATEQKVGVRIFGVIFCGFLGCLKRCSEIVDIIRSNIRGDIVDIKVS